MWLIGLDGGGGGGAGVGAGGGVPPCVGLGAGVEAAELPSPVHPAREMIDPKRSEQSKKRTMARQDIVTSKATPTDVPDHFPETMSTIWNFRAVPESERNRKTSLAVASGVRHWRLTVADKMWKHGRNLEGHLVARRLQPDRLALVQFNVVVPGIQLDAAAER